MTLKGAKRRRYMRTYMRSYREQKAADAPAEITEVRLHSPTVEIEQNPYPIKAEPVKPQFVRPFSKQDQARGRRE